MNLAIVTRIWLFLIMTEEAVEWVQIKQSYLLRKHKWVIKVISTCLEVVLCILLKCFGTKQISVAYTCLQSDSAARQEKEALVSGGSWTHTFMSSTWPSPHWSFRVIQQKVTFNPFYIAQKSQPLSLACFHIYISLHFKWAERKVLEFLLPVWHNEGIHSTFSFVQCREPNYVAQNFKELC